MQVMAFPVAPFPWPSVPLQVSESTVWLSLGVEGGYLSSGSAELQLPLSHCFPVRSGFVSLPLLLAVQSGRVFLTALHADGVGAAALSAGRRRAVEVVSCGEHVWEVAGSTALAGAWPDTASRPAAGSDVCCAGVKAGRALCGTRC